MSNHQNRKRGGFPPGDSKEMSKSANNNRKHIAKFIAMFVRDGIEDFHCQYLTDKQMRELNPLVRDAIYTAFYVIEHRRDPRFKEFIKDTLQAIPSYWEDPELWPGLVDPQKRDEKATL